MAVVPQLGLVQQKEKYQPHQQHQEQVPRTGLALKGLGQQVHEGRGHQGPGRQAQHVLGVAPQGAKTQGGGQPHTSNAGRQGSHQDCNQRQATPFALNQANARAKPSSAASLRKLGR